MNKIVVPGDLLADAPISMENALIYDNKTYAAILGLYDDEKKTLIPLEGTWNARRGDTVIGIVDEVRLNSYSVDLNSPFKGMLISRFVSSRLQIGSVVEAKVKELDETKTVMLMYAKKLYGGKIIDIPPTKVPRVIGKGNTMIKQTTEGTNSSIIVGMNGRIWIKGGDVAMATEAILRIVEEAHTEGLTERIAEMLKQGKKVV